jgi:hypothetical protein
MKKFLKWFKEFLSDCEDPKAPKYDPVHIGMTVVFTIFAIALLFWLLWCLMVFGGGLQVKIVPAFQLATHVRTPSDFGYIGYPYEMGVFEGWPTNVIALIFLFLLIAGVWVLLKEPLHSKGYFDEDKLQQ